VSSVSSKNAEDLLKTLIVLLPSLQQQSFPKIKGPGPESLVNFHGQVYVSSSAVTAVECVVVVLGAQDDGRPA
jgi:hypothetical protein